MKIDKQSTDLTLRVLLVVGLIVFAIVTRLLPHPPNFAPITAIAIFGGALLPRNWALLLPLGAIVASDLIIGIHPLILFTWGSFLLIGLLSYRYFNTIKSGMVVGASLLASILFFVITNFGVWLEGRLYPPTLEGLTQSYINALPFFRNTLLGDLVFSGLLFGSYVLIVNHWPRLVASEQTTTRVRS